ncbi:hypothetical protein HMPREF0501_00955 [Limosilactobacillus coleohominis 101-4-CHN]|uniref:Uncharacterized protein n=1 Tax=Limosilactobacillus coleohominis 101-4-CHN TaxID=575594 RepID=C7XV46_9LACO|nr:hypothetical protein [Limosilactobacillus coleohominis]EEU30577.1 hypothetical protein HMPREF0501_00955 [Limosilactobacillus coleohominis 101-4-CHN]
MSSSIIPLVLYELLIFTLLCCNNSSYIAGIILIVIMLVLAIVGRNHSVVSDRKISDWLMGIGIAFVGACGDDGLYPMLAFVILGIFSIYLSVFVKRNKLLQMSKKYFLSGATIIIGLIVYAIGNNANYNTAHIETSDYSINLGKKSATITGYATPNAKVKTYLNGDEIKPAEKSDDDGYFEFDARTPGKWIVKVSKNGQTASDYTVVKKTSTWKKYQAKQGAKEAKKDFAVAYADAFDKLDSIGVSEYNAWAEENNSGSGGTIDDTLESIQKKHVKDVLAIESDISDMKEALKRLKEGNMDDYKEYRAYYSDIKKLENTVLNPPAGEIDNFGDEFEDGRNTVNSNLDFID